jgi:hypothetical protein
VRDYAKFSPLFWVRGSGRKLRGETDAQLVACYLISSGGSTMTGIYFLALGTIVAETGMPESRVRAALERCEAAGFARYDFADELVFIIGHAEIEFGDGLKVRDKRRDGIANALAKLKQHRFAVEFRARYDYLLPLAKGHEGHKALMGDDDAEKGSPQPSESTPTPTTNTSVPTPAASASPEEEHTPEPYGDVEKVPWRPWRKRVPRGQLEEQETLYREAMRAKNRPDPVEWGDDEQDVVGEMLSRLGTRGDTAKVLRAFVAEQNEHYKRRGWTVAKDTVLKDLNALRAKACAPVKARPAEDPAVAKSKADEAAARAAAPLDWEKLKREAFGQKGGADAPA